MKKIKGDSHPMLTEITYDVKTPAALNLHDHGLVELELADPTQFNLHQVVRYADFHIFFISHGEGISSILTCGDQPVPLPTI